MHRGSLNIFMAHTGKYFDWLYLSLSPWALTSQGQLFIASPAFALVSKAYFSTVASVFISPQRGVLYAILEHHMVPLMWVTSCSMPSEPSSDQPTNHRTPLQQLLCYCGSWLALMPKVTPWPDSIFMQNNQRRVFNDQRPKKLACIHEEL